MENNKMQETISAIHGSEALIAALDALTPNQRNTKAERFREVLPAIERALSRKVTQKQICEQLKQAGLPMSPQTFKSMLSRERQARAAGSVAMPFQVASELLPNDNSASGPSNVSGVNASVHYAQRQPAPRR